MYIPVFLVKVITNNQPIKLNVFTIMEFLNNLLFIFFSQQRCKQNMHFFFQIY